MSSRSHGRWWDAEGIEILCATDCRLLVCLCLVVNCDIICVFIFLNVFLCFFLILFCCIWWLNSKTVWRNVSSLQIEFAVLMSFRKCLRWAEQNLYLKMGILCFFVIFPRFLLQDRSPLTPTNSFRNSPTFLVCARVTAVRSAGDANSQGASDVHAGTLLDLQGKTSTAAAGCLPGRPLGEDSFVGILGDFWGAFNEVLI